MNAELRRELALDTADVYKDIRRSAVDIQQDIGVRDATVEVTRHAVVRFVPDSVTGEFVNVGVVAWRDGEVATCWALDWDRAVRFADGRPDREAVEEMLNNTMRYLSHGGVAAIEAARGWANCIQLSEPGASMLGPDATAHAVATYALRRSKKENQ